MNRGADAALTDMTLAAKLEPMEAIRTDIEADEAQAAAFEILRPDGSERLFHEASGGTGDAEALGSEAAAALRGRAGPGFFDA